jgi:hypothetical protein
MSTSPNLAITLLSSSQATKYVTVNEAIDALDEALCGLVSEAMSDANFNVPTADALEDIAFIFTGALTAGRNVIVPNNKKLYVVSNQTSGGFSITVKTSGGTGVAIASTNWSLLYCDGTNVKAVGTGATAFTGLSDVPASYSGDGGFAVEVNSGATALVFNAKPFDVGVFAPGAGSNNQKLVRLNLARAVKFPAGASASYAVASAAATGSTTFTLKKNGTSFATVNFPASATTGTWTQASDATFAAGDLLEIDGPATADATLADVGITLSGTRT